MTIVASIASPTDLSHMLTVWGHAKEIIKYKDAPSRVEATLIPFLVSDSDVKIRDDTSVRAPVSAEFRASGLLPGCLLRRQRMTQAVSLPSKSV